jgi:hypothetical protein
MTKIDWTLADELNGFRPGIYLVEVADSRERESQAGDPYFELMLKAVEFGRELCVDRLMLGGNGARIGLRKLQALGFGRDEDVIECDDLFDRRAFVAVHEEEYQGVRRLACNISAGGMCGYWPDHDEPEGVIRPDPNSPS